MYKKNISILMLLLFMISGIDAQKKNIPIANINVVARYLDKQNKVELRFVPTTKSVLYYGIHHGFIIERAEVLGKIQKESDLKYKKIAEVKAFSEKQWSLAMFGADKDLKNRYEMAKDFYDASKKNRKNKAPSDIASLMQQKNASDLEYAFLVLTAIQQSKVADALGLGYTDKSVQKNKKYVYRVSMAQYKGPYKVIPVPYVITTKKAKQINRAVDVYEGDTKLIFSWLENDMISGVRVERKDPKTGKFVPLDKNVKYSLESNSLKNGFEDTGLVNYQTYEYRFYGHNVFGETVKFAEIKATPRDRTPPKSPIMISATHISENAVEIKWDVPEPDSDLKGFKILRGESSDYGFNYITKTILSKDARSFIDHDFLRNGKNYYVVQAIDQENNSSASFAGYATLMDTIPPSKPKISNVLMDSLGIVTITVSKNPEKDLMGYRLLWANAPDHEFIAIQDGFKEHLDDREKVQLQFKDTVTLRSLSRFVYYKVAAVDEHYNQSLLSDPYKVKRIDTIPPTAPIIKDVIVHPDKIQIFFVKSVSKDVQKHFIYRRTSQNEKWKVLNEIKNGADNYVDETVQIGKTYYYSLRARDDSHLYSKYAISVQGTPYDTGLRDQVRNFTVRKHDKKLELKWEYKKDKNTYFAIYRSNAKGKLVQYKVTEKLSFLDSIGKKPRRYAVKAFTKDGGQSKLSKVLSYPPL